MDFKTYTKTNFHKNTFCIFKEVGWDAIADLKPNYKSKSGSSYYFTDKGVFRLSNHWGRAANCRWRLQKKLEANEQRTKLGFANWEDFHPDNDFQKLYFIEVDFEKRTAEFYHKNSKICSDETVFRTASDTAKRIKQIRNLFEDAAWAKYLKDENTDQLQKEIIDKLVTTNQSFQEIRSSFL